MAARLPNKRVLIDFDGVLITKDRYRQRTPVEGAQAAVRGLKRLGYEIVVFSSRLSGGDIATERNRQFIDKFLHSHGIPYDRMTSDKLNADYYIDDKAIGFTSWDDAMQQIK